MAGQGMIAAVDHVTLRTDQAQFAQVWSLFTQTLGLPTAWPVRDRYPGEPGFTSGGIGVGSVSIEIFRAGSAMITRGRLYSLALDPGREAAQTVAALDARHIGHSVMLAVPEDTFGRRGSLWTLIFLDGLLGGDLSRLPQVPDGSPGQAVLTDRFDVAFADGMVFVCAFTPSPVYDPAKLKYRNRLALREANPLGVIDTMQIDVGEPNLDPARAGWEQLLGAPDSHGRWDLGEGPRIRLAPAARSGITGLTWRVASLEAARAYLDTHHLIDQTPAHGRVAIRSPLLDFTITLTDAAD